MRFDEYRRHDAVGLADLVAKREVSAAELLDAAVQRMAQVNPQINAVTLDLTERARSETPSPGPLHGVPYLLKDLGAALAGTPTSRGSRLFANNVAAADSPLVAAYKAAGLNIFGKTSTPEFGLWPVTESELLGVCRNPWDLSRSPGGSSGGAASAVAAGIVPAAHASDGGGSIRIPAAACGLFGMKPSRGRVSMAPAGEGWAGASVVHAVTRSVRDSAVLLDISCKPQPGDPYFLAPPERPFAEAVGRDPGRLRIAFSTEAMQSDRLDPEVEAAVIDAAKLCESLGHAVEQVKIPGDVQAMAQAAGGVIAASIAADMETEAARRGRPIVPGDVEGPTFASYQRGLNARAADHVRGIQALHAYGRAIAGLFADYDVLLLATLGRPAIPIGYLFEDPDDVARRLFNYMPNTQAFNNSGMPAMSVPLAWSRDNLPIGLQFAAPIGEEARLFSLAGQLETARPWFDRVAPL